MTGTSTAADGGGRGGTNRGEGLVRRVALSFLVALIIGLGPGAPVSTAQAVPGAPADDNLLHLLGIQASEESLDYVMNKTQFQLHTLLTEQRHPRTMSLSDKVQKSAAAGLDILFGVDADVAAKLESLALDPRALEAMSAQVSAALLEKRKIYIYGCGATGRLAKQMESAFWRPFWRRVKSDAGLWKRAQAAFGADVEHRLMGEMTGGDRALTSSLEGFEDLQLIGRLQLEDRKVAKGDLVIAVTEGGETSSVIGTILGALDQWKASPSYQPQDSRRRLYFVYNNPDDRLLPFERSRKVLEEPGITKINLTTGPQAITGSTRMQATTIETFVIGHVLEDALARALKPFVSSREMEALGFAPGRTLAERLRDFAGVLASVRDAIPALAPVTELESRTYAQGRFSTYFAERALITVFIDSTERSPTFRLFPLDTVSEPRRKCWIQVWTPAAGPKEAWMSFLGRPFRGLAPSLYQKPFEDEIEDDFLRTAALESLKKAGDDQAAAYDFSFSPANVARRGPLKGDLGVAAVLSEDLASLEGPSSPVARFLDLFGPPGRRAVLLAVVRDRSGKPPAELTRFLRERAAGRNPPLVVEVRVPGEDDPFGVNENIALKIMLNAHSTAVMARLGRVIGNTMTNVSPSNLKLIGRATFLIQSHVNDLLSRPAWVQKFGLRRPVTYGEANAVLFEAIRFVKDHGPETGQTAEVGLSIIRILESLKEKRGLSADESLTLLQSKGLARFLSEITN